MRTPNLRLLSRFLLFIWFFQATAGFLAYESLRHDCREVFESHPFTAGEQLTVLHFSTNAQIPWEESGKELNWKGVLYDVVAVQSTSTGIRLTVWNDSKETTLVHRHLDNEENNNRPMSVPHVLFTDLTSVVSDQSLHFFDPFVILLHSSDATPTTLKGEAIALIDPPEVA